MAVQSALPAGAQKINLPPVTRVTWDNGARIVLMEYHRASVLTVTALYRGGSSGDPADKAGVAALTASLLRQGTERRTAPQIAEEIDFLGGSLQAGADDDRLSISLNVLAKDIDAGLDLFADVIRHPTFPPEELERERQLGLAGLESLAEDAAAVADRVASETVYAGHPYGIESTMTSLKAITRGDLLAYYRRFIVPDRMIIVAVGDFKAADMLARLRARFGDWPRSEEVALSVLPVKPTSRRIALIDKPDATQTQVRFGRVALPRVHPDYFPARLAATLLGGGFTSRLNTEIRINRSLTYDISASFAPQLHGGDFTVSTYTKIETTRALLDATNVVLRRAAAQGFTNAELQKVKNYLSGLFAIGAQTPEALAAQLASIAFYGLPDDYLQTYLARLRAVTLDQVNRIAKTYFMPGTLSLVFVAPAAKIRGQLKGLGNIETRSIETVGR